MGQMEIESQRRAKKANLKKHILSAVKVAGVLSVALVAPNVVGAMQKLGMISNPRHTESINASRHRLVRKGMLRYENGLLRLTQKGERELRTMDFQLPRPRKWDQKWRLLIFDIPERRRSLRTRVRKSLINIGFYRLQDSVWVYPYDCEDIIVMLKADFHVGKDVLYIIADSIENDRHLKQEFGLR